MGWGYGNCSTTSFATDMQSSKKLINKTGVGTKIYESTIGKGILKTSVIWHDNRKTKYPSFLIIERQSFNIDTLKTQKEIFEFAEEKLKELKIISVM